MPVSYMTLGFLPVKSTMTTLARKIKLKTSWMMVLSSQMSSARRQRRFVSAHAAAIALCTIANPAPNGIMAVTKSGSTSALGTENTLGANVIFRSEGLAEMYTDSSGKRSLM